MSDEYLGINLTPEEKRRVRMAASRRDLSMSEYVRNIIRDDLEEEFDEQPTEA